jgi:UDP-N-acetylglucosamine--N-acetylmuramyl-(pentapeptide) pyrophosphoryl-undecaprenol N-acetylglucosamine transferase
LEHVLIAGGGTGGHLFPGLAVAQVIKKQYRNVEVRFLGTERGIEARVVPREGFELLTVPVRGFPRHGLGRQIQAAWAFLASIFVTWRHFMRWRPDVILGTGGYASAPAVLVGRIMRIPIVLQEQNSVPGVVNRWMSSVATEVHINFAGSRIHFKRRDHLRLTGNPLRPSLFRGNRQRAFKRFGLSPERRTVVVIGGSRGARRLNEAVAGALLELPKSLEVQFLIQTGREDHEAIAARVESAPFPTSVHAFLNNVEDAYTVADLIICRAGAMTLSEITACGIPSILVPYPHATNNHQEANAREMVDRGASVMILDAELDASRLASQLQDLLGDNLKLRRMATNAHGSARYEGAERLAAALAALAPDREGGEGI